jgi:hypothetical protein
MDIALLRFRWWIWITFYDRCPEILLPILDGILPTKEELKMLDDLDGISE